MRSHDIWSYWESLPDSLTSKQIIKRQLFCSPCYYIHAFSIFHFSGHASSIKQDSDTRSILNRYRYFHGRIQDNGNVDVTTPALGMGCMHSEDSSLHMCYVAEGDVAEVPCCDPRFGVSSEFTGTGSLFSSSSRLCCSSLFPTLLPLPPAEFSSRERMTLDKQWQPLEPPELSESRGREGEKGKAKSSYNTGTPRRACAD